MTRELLALRPSFNQQNCSPKMTVHQILHTVHIASSLERAANNQQSAHKT
jgi:hypothetical protein